MDWLRWIGRSRSESAEDVESPDGAPAPVERTTPGVVALLDGMREDGSHSVLDLGPASASSFRVYSRFARRVRFADLVSDAASRQGPTGAFHRLVPEPEQPYDLLFGWDVLDRILPEERPDLVRRLAELSAPNARLHLMVEAGESSTVEPRRFSLLDVDRMRYESTGPARHSPGRLLPAQVATLLHPFEVLHAFTSKSGMREYVAVRRKD